MGKRSDFPRRKQDDYRTTDARAVRALLPFLQMQAVKNFAEPCAGDGDLMRGLESIGLLCVQASDINDGVDALTIADFKRAHAIITNPPWTRRLLHPMILHFQKHLPTWLLFDADWAYNKSAAPYLDQCSHIVAIGRLNWITGTKSTGKDNASWYRFWHRHSGGPHFYNRRK